LRATINLTSATRNQAKVAKVANQLLPRKNILQRIVEKMSYWRGSSTPKGYLLTVVYAKMAWTRYGMDVVDNVLHTDPLYQQQL
jgi:hypothetical protein